MAPSTQQCDLCSDNFIVNSKFIQCDLCEKRYHLSCAKVKDQLLRYLQDCDNLNWFCNKCLPEVKIKIKSPGTDKIDEVLHKTEELINLIQNVCLGNDRPHVETLLGSIRGNYLTSLLGRRYCAFEGVPYAKPPVGRLRFEKSQLVDPWNGLLDATEPTTCLQLSAGVTGDEDCLHLNIYVPCENGLDPKQSYDIIVYIHGGGFMMGYGHSLKAKYMMDKDWIVISLNYRLGVLGFISTEDDVLPGNNGLKDQVLALTWVQKYISYFGGNPKSVTVTGLSAGGASTHMHYLSPLSKDLFVRGISHGGSALMPFVLKKNPRETAMKTANLVGCPEQPSSALKECLKTQDAGILFLNYFYFYGYGTLPMGIYSAVVEKGVNGAFLPDHPYKMMKEKNLADKPWIASTTTNEGIIITGALYESIDEIDEIWTKVAPYILDCNDTLPETEREEFAKKVKECYIGPEGHWSKQNFDKFTEMFSDRNILEPVETAAKMQTESCSSPVYYYIFGYTGNNRIAHMVYPNVPSDGVSHTEDAVFCYGYMAENEFSETDYQIWEAFQNMLHKYASSGEVSFELTDQWEPLKSSKFNLLRISSPSECKQEVVKGICPSDFWHSLGFRENQNLFK